MAGNGILSDILERIRAACALSGRPPESVRLVAVSKGQAWEKIARLVEQGQEDFGENYVQEWKQKLGELNALRPPPSLRWHFIGHLQSNKAAEVVGAAEWIHSVDSLLLAKKIDGLASQKSLMQRVLLEINLTGESRKTGFSPNQVREALPALAKLSHLHVAGLMALPPAPRHPEDSRPHFASLKSLLDECNQMGVFKRSLNELSMGMSQDFEIAIQEGATMVRIGTALFGERQ